MEIIIHRGSHQIGGIATEVRTAKTRIIIDLGAELGLGEAFVPEELNIPGVTDKSDEARKPDAVLFTHQHGDHMGQLYQLRDDVPIYMGKFTRDLELVNECKYQECPEVRKRIEQTEIFTAGQVFKIGDIKIRPISVDHSAGEAFMFLLEAENKKVLYTGDFRTHGFTGAGVVKALEAYVKKVDVVVTEGTTFSREDYKQVTEAEILAKTKRYLKQYKYVFVLCSSMNVDRIAGAAAAVPVGKYFLCDEYQANVIELIKEHKGKWSPLYNIDKTVTYGNNILDRFQNRGFLMLIRANDYFAKILSKFPKDQSIILYGLWKGYLNEENSPYKSFLEGYNWEYLHTSGHACIEDVKEVLDLVKPEVIIPMHTELPEALVKDYLDKVKILKDGEVYEV